MTLSELIKTCSTVLADPFGPAGLTGEEKITSVTTDSRQVAAGGLFIAVKGFAANGHDYIDQAIQNGAIAVVAQENIHNRDCVILVKDTRRSTAAIAAAFYGHPSRDLTLVGITGTNGKTTTSYLLESIFKAAGFSTGVIGTVNIRYNDRVLNAPITTPDAIVLQKTLHKMKRAGVTHVIMEVSSHGLDLHRVDDCEYDAGIFTNLTQDHLDYHQDMEDYFNCKKRFFTDLLKPGASTAIVNIDDAYGKKLNRLLAGDVRTISTQTATGLYAVNIEDSIRGITATLCRADRRFSVHSTLTGRFNLENILCAAGAALTFSVSKTDIQKGIETCHAIPGRLEPVTNTINRHLFVDFAHTPDALDSILTTLKQRAPKRLICVFGCGGDRDRAKRPRMGQVALKHSDISIITSDNPRSENPDQIIDDIVAGLDGFQRLNREESLENPLEKGYLVEVSRKKALELAVFISKPDDIIVAAGKGHETYQITNTGTIHFDDTEELDSAATTLADHFSPIAWSRTDLETALGCTPELSQDSPDPTFAGISTDSRAITENQVFLALKGEKFDGHDYIDDLVEKGVRAFVISKAFWASANAEQKERYLQHRLLFFVCGNTLHALGRLGRFQRDRADVKVVAITGSSGKTTTRKICEDIFCVKYHTLATQGNLNNEIGVPLTLLKLSKAHEWAIIEMGMNHPGEIARLTQIARPDMAMVLNTAGVHLEGLGNVENVAKAKAEIFQGLQKNSTAILPAADPRRDILETAARQNPDIKRFLFFGSGNGSHLAADQITANDMGIEFTTPIDGVPDRFSIPSPGRFMVNNCLAAILAAQCADIRVNEIKSGFSSFSPVPGRMVVTQLTDSLTLIDDTYNANPSSTAKALETLKAIGKDRQRIVVLGDMLELGDASDTLHRDIGRKAADSGISHLFVHGDQAGYLVKGAIEVGMSPENIFHGEKKIIAQKVWDLCSTATCVLVKGSRGMAMETVIEEIRQLALPDIKGRQ